MADSQSIAASLAIPASPGAPRTMLRALPDARLARLAADGSRAAFAAIVDRHQPALARYCLSLVGNPHDAADALQNTLLKALRALDGETREIALRPWLFRIAHNESISLLRARRSDAGLEAAADTTDENAERLVEVRERLRALARDLGELTPQQRAALLLRELWGLEFGEIAGALQISPAAAKQSLHEARGALRSIHEGRAMDCETVRRTLSTGDRRKLRAVRVRSHLHGCASCRGVSGERPPDDGDAAQRLGLGPG